MLKKVMKRGLTFVLACILAICFVIGMMPTNRAEAASNYTADWQRWSQGASGYSAMQYGCRVTAYAKMLAEAGYTGFGNPDGFFEWGKGKGYFRASDTCELTSLGVAPVTYVNSNGGTASLAGKQPLSGNKTADANTIMNLINQGYYVMLTCSAHSAYVGRADSISQGTAVILDSWASRTVGPSFQYRNYTQYTFQNAYYFRITNNNPVFCNCSDGYAGNYIVNTNNAPLNIRNSHGGGSVIGSIPKGATVYVSKGNGSWAHVTYNGVSGLCSMEWLSKVVEHEKNPPVISNVQIISISSEGYEVAARIEDASGINRVQFPTWTEANGQDDLAGDWGTNPACSGHFAISSDYEGDMAYEEVDGKMMLVRSSVFFHVKISDHNNERGTYITHIYAYDIYGNVNSCGVTIQVPEPDTDSPVISNVKITDISPLGYTVTADVSDDSGIDRVQFPTWTTANGKDDLVADWATNPACKGTIENGTVTFRVKTSDHNLEAGNYVTHIYAYDKSGNVTEYNVGELIILPVEDCAEDFGNDFQAEVRWITYNLYLTADNATAGGSTDKKAAVYLDEQKHSDSQLWHFVKNSDGKSYTILSKMSGHALSAVDEVTGNTSDEILNNKVWTTPLNGSDGQSWYIVKWLNGYCLIPKLKWGEWIIMTGFSAYNMNDNLLGMWRGSSNASWGARFEIQKVNEPTSSSQTNPKPSSIPALKNSAAPITPSVIPSANPQNISSKYPTNTNTSNSDFVYGDLDFDGKVTLQDAKKVLKAALNLIKLSEKESAVADVDRDYVIRLNDAKKILRMALSIEKTIPLLTISGADMFEAITDYYNSLSDIDGEYVIFDIPQDVQETADSYIAIVRYQMTDEEAQEMIDRGCFPSANIYATMVTVDKATGIVYDEGGNIYRYVKHT